MHIRKAVVSDADRIAPLLFLAMEEIIYAFVGEASREKGIAFLSGLVQQKANQYSYENCWVVTQPDDTIIAAACIYNGGDLERLKAPVAATVQHQFAREFNPEAETHEGEYYIDSVGVAPDAQGTGVGSFLFRFLIQEYVVMQQQTLGLLVDDENPGALKLYLKLGFKEAGQLTFSGKSMAHLQLRPENTTLL